MRLTMVVRCALRGGEFFCAFIDYRHLHKCGLVDLIAVIVPGQSRQSKIN